MATMTDNNNGSVLTGPVGEPELASRPAPEVTGNNAGSQGKPKVSSNDSAAKTRNDRLKWRNLIRNFTPSWFAITMGTGIVSILLHQMPYIGSQLYYPSVVVFMLNIVLFTSFTVVTVLRYVLWPEIWVAMILHPGQSLFVGCFPMGLATIINMTVLVCHSWGSWLMYLAWGLWWLDVVLSVTSCITVPFIVMHRHKPQYQQVTAAQLLPIVPNVVAAASGGLVAEYLPDPNHAATTLIVSYVLWGMGISLSCLVLALYFSRLHLHSLPSREVLVSVLLPVGPLGQGGFGILQLGTVAMTSAQGANVFKSLNAADATANGAQVLYMLGVFLSLFMWGAGLCWLAFAIITITTAKTFPFNMGWWGFTFPLGVFATCTGLLGEELNSPAFKVLSMIFSFSVICLWVLVSARTLKLAWTGEMFFAPCLADLRPKTEQADGDRQV